MANLSQIKLPNGTTYNIKDSISGYTTNTGTITQVKTTAGAHTTIDVSSGAATFNVPTKTSHLTNDSGFITNAGVTGVKGNAENSYRTGDVNITADNVNAITKNLSGNTQNLRRPSTLQGANDITIDSKINTLRANRLAFLPADQIIIEKTIDGGATWTDAEIADATKVGLFSETRPSVIIPLLNGKKSPLCGLRFTITAMKYNVPAGTAETAKYSYWNKDYIKSTERYNQLKEMYFWVSTSGGYINVKVERATGANPTNWSVISNDTSFNMTGYSGNDYISFSQGVFGGGTTQVNNYWNYRITFMTDDYIPASPYDGYSQSIMEIRGYGDTWWTAGNEYAANDHLYTHDYLKNATFPANVTATQFNGNVQATTINGVAVGSSPKFTDTTNTTGSSNLTGGKLYIIGAIQQASSAQTYSNNQIYIDDDNSFHINSALAIKCIDNNYHGVFQPASGFTANRVYTLPNKAGTVALTSDIPTVPSSTGSATTGITASTTATKTTLGTAFTIPNVTSAGSASSWVFEEITIPNVTSAGSASTWTFEEKTIPNVTSAGSASTWAFTSKTVVTGVTFAMDTTDTKKLKITTSTDTVYSKSSGSNGTAPTLGTAIKVQSKSGGGNGTAPTLGTAIKVQSKKSGANGSAPTLGTAFTVPNVTGNTSATVSITDNGHTHTI